MQHTERGYGQCITVVASVLLGLLGSACSHHSSSYESALKDSTRTYAVGVVFDDRNGNQQREPNEPGIAGVRVSNGRDIVSTDRSGRYGLPVDDDAIIFVIKPSGWMTPIDEHNLPRFYYRHKPAGSPPLRYAGVSPTGPLPKSINFPLYRRSKAKRFKAVFFGDPQPYSKQEVYFFAHDIVEELVGVEAAFGISLGDLVGDDLSLFEPLNEVVGHIGIPWYNVLGNHDMNYDAADDEHSDESFERVYGPPCYAFEYGDVHFIVLDDVAWSGAGENNRGKYHGEIGAKQLEFIRNDLATTPRERLVVMMMHIPLASVQDRSALFALLADRPHTLSIAAHHHVQNHEFYGKNEGWSGHGHHHHFVNVTTSGSWCKGALDEEGIPHHDNAGRSAQWLHDHNI